MFMSYYRSNIDMSSVAVITAISFKLLFIIQYYYDPKLF